MTQRVIWQFDRGMGLAQDTICQAVAEFYKKYEMKPNVIRLSVDDCARFVAVTYGPQIHLMEKDKEYAHYVNSPCGPLLLDLIEESEEQTHLMGPPSVPFQQTGLLFVESDAVDREFEKQILNKED